MKKYCLFLIILFFILIIPLKSQETNYHLGEFGAFYTRIHSGEDFEKYARVGDYSDIIVDLGKNGLTFIFWRGSSYLPYLKLNGEKYYVEKVISQNGDGTNKRPDKVNLFSRVKIIKNTVAEVIVHWRYMPVFEAGNPYKGIKPTEFVDEYFYIHPDGTVKRIIKEGTQKIDEWEDPKNHITQTFNLTVEGIKGVKTERAKRSEDTEIKYGAPLMEKIIVEPIAWWKFDEGQGGITKETQSGKKSQVFGHKALWKEGVSGTCLQFDGYNSVIKIPDEEATHPEDAITIEGWIAVGAYPWSYVPIVQQIKGVPEEIKPIGEGENNRFDFILKNINDTGYFFGLDAYGNPVFMLGVDGKWEILTADFHLERRIWYHLVATYAKKTGLMKIFVNGKPIASKRIAKSTIELSDMNLKIGQGKPRRPIILMNTFKETTQQNSVIFKAFRNPAGPIRKDYFIDTYSFDGLIDEIKIYDIALSSDQINDSYHLYDLNKGRYALADMDERNLPLGKELDQFGAYYTHLSFYETWDNLWRVGEYSDVVVEFSNNPSKFIFWRGTSFIPMIVNEKEQWYSNEFNETWHTSGGEGCQEPMSEKECYYSHARIIENTPARVVIQWRYPLTDVNGVRANYDKNTGWCDVSDWYYYIYPDGIAAKIMHLWTHGKRNHEWQESMVIIGPDQHPEQIIDTRNTITMFDLNGNYKVYDWEKGPPDNIKFPEDQKIQYINYTGKYDPVTIGDFQRSDVYINRSQSYSVFPTWNHWPVAQILSDGRNAVFPDRTSHSSLTHVYPSIYKEKKYGPTPYYEKILLEGMLNKSRKEIVAIARSWINPPKITDIHGAEGSYDPSQRAYVLSKENSNIQLSLNCSEESPLINVCFVIKEWNNDKYSIISVDGRDITREDKLKQGIMRDTNGTKKLVIWMQKKSTKPIKLNICTKK